MDAWRHSHRHMKATWWHCWFPYMYRVDIWRTNEVLKQRLIKLWDWWCYFATALCRPQSLPVTFMYICHKTAVETGHWLKNQSEISTAKNIAWAICNSKNSTRHGKSKFWIRKRQEKFARLNIPKTTSFTLLSIPCVTQMEQGRYTLTDKLQQHFANAARQIHSTRSPQDNDYKTDRGGGGVSSWCLQRNIILS